MIFAGCDVGSLTAKAVILEENTILGSSVIPAKADPIESGEDVMAQALDSAGLKMDDIGYTISTGYGKDLIPFANASQSEISCHARGAWWCLPTARTVIDIGGQDAKAIRVDEKGNVVNYRYNDKCATGTGRFLEVMAEALEVKLEEMGDLAEKSKEKVHLSSQCVIFAETEIVSLINEGVAVPDVVKGLNRSLSSRVAALVKSIGAEDDVVFTGGVAKNMGVFKSLEKILAAPLHALNGKDPQINGALGAALLAQEMVEKVRVAS